MTLFISACVYGPAVITDDMTPAVLIQRAQEASDHNAYDVALEYYTALLNRYGDNIELVCTGEYEIAFINYKQKKYPEAREKLNALLARYDSPNEALMPPQFKRLSTIVLERITVKEQDKKKKTKEAAPQS